MVTGLRFRSGWTLERRRDEAQQPEAPLWTPDVAPPIPAAPTPVPLDLGELAQWAVILGLVAYLAARRRRD